MDKIIKSVIRLRRDNELNYQKIADKFVPASGEICLVDTSDGELRAICGDGISTYSQLSFIDDIFVKGYLFNGEFYNDVNKSTVLSRNINRLYIDKASYNIFFFDGDGYQNLAYTPAATKETAGILKLYDTTGDNEDGTMTQKAITAELKKKIEMNIDEETLNLFGNLI